MAKESWKDQKPENPKLFVPGDRDRSFEKLDDALHNAIRKAHDTDDIPYLEKTLTAEERAHFERNFGRMDGVINRDGADVHARERERADRIHFIEQIQNIQKEWNKVVGILAEERSRYKALVAMEAEILAKPFFKRIFEFRRFRDIRSLREESGIAVATRENQLRHYGARLREYGYAVPADNEPFVPPPHTYKQ